MSLSARQVAIFVAGLVLGLAAAWMVMNRSSPPAGEPSKSAAPPSSTPAAGSAKESAAPPAGTKSAAGAGSSACPPRTITALAGEKDGQFKLQSDVSSKSDKDIGAFIVVGKEAAASGRPRDAEVAFLMSCRVAEQHKGADSLQVADAKYQLAWHYANLALHGGRAHPARAELLRQAEQLYVASLDTYREHHGPTHEKTRFAADGLAALRQAAAGPATAAAPAAPAKQPAAAAAPAPPARAAAAPARPREPAVEATPPSGPSRTPAAVAPRAQPPTQAAADKAAPASKAATAREATAAPPSRPAVAQGSATAGAEAAQPIRASFDCTKARSRAERIICSDPELARQDRELGQLYARARRAAPDAAAFRRHSEQEWRRREATCGDRECLLRWYAQRRGQLLEDLGSSEAAPSSRPL